MTANLKQRKLYQVRVYPQINGFGRHVGHKMRLLPFRPAQRVMKRLKRTGLDIVLVPVLVNCTPEQIAYLDRRYGK
jgi:hypothetical protein